MAPAPSALPRNGVSGTERPLSPSLAVSRIRRWTCLIVLVAGTRLLAEPTSRPRDETAAADGGGIQAFVPADCLTVLSGRPLPSFGQRALPSSTSAPAAADAPSSQPSLEQVLGLLEVTGLLRGGGQVFADIVAGLPLLSAHEFAIILLDARTAVTPNAMPSTTRPSIRLQSLQAAIVLRTNGQDDEALSWLNRVIGRYTNSDEASLSEFRIGEATGQRLVDRRTPEWVVFEWSRIEPAFVMGLGHGSVERVAAARRRRAPRLADDPWYVSARARCAPQTAWVEFFMNFDEARARLGAAAAARIDAWQRAIQANRTSRELWIFGADHREWACRRVAQTEGGDRLRVYAGRPGDAERYATIVPAGARRFAVLRLPLADLIRDLPTALLAIQSGRTSSAMQRWWSAWEQDKGFDIDGALLANLGNELLIMDYPPHPLGVPLALTVAAPIRRSPEVRAALAAALEAWEQRLARGDRSSLLRMSVQRTSDDIWFLRVGVAGPALKVCDKFIVLSWSPQALREVLPLFEQPRP